MPSTDVSTRAVIYARYSSELQSEASIEDQIALCRDRAESLGWRVVEVFTDYALSGASMKRPGVQAMIELARASGLDVVVAEGLDRLSRDQEDIAGLYKRLTAWQIQIVTLAEGEVNELHVGLKGTMNALFLKDLAAKTLRGQIGRARNGYAAGGIPYGYEVVRKIGDDGELIRGHRRIVPDEAVIVRRIFEEFAGGRSSVAIAKGLNADGVPSPRGGQWNPSTIQGHRGRGVGLLSNPIYVGRPVFNRHAFVRDPDSGARHARAKDASEWIEADVPALAIIDEAVWQHVQDRIVATPAKRPEHHRRPKRLFSGLIECGVCGSKLTIAYEGRYGCAAARLKGTCFNNRTMSGQEIENRVLGGLREGLLEPELVQAYLDEYHAELQKLQKDTRRRRREIEKQRAELERQIARIVDAIAEGSIGNVGAVGQKLRDLEEKLASLPASASQDPAPVDWHPNAIDIYKHQIEDLSAALNADTIVREEATSALRGLVDRIVAWPAEKRGQFELELHGQLAVALNMANHDNDGGASSLLRTILCCFGGC